MKNKFKFIVLIIASTITMNNSFAQLDMQAFGFNRWGRLNPVGAFNPSAIGIGNFASPNSPQAALHVNTNLVPNPFYGAGELFRTSGTSTAINCWKMFTGAGNGVERFRIYTQPNPFNVFFETTTQNAIFGIRTGNIGTSGLRFLVNGQASVNATAGRIAMGYNLTEDFVPQDRLHLHHGNASIVRMRYTNRATDSLSLDGFAVGIQGNGDFRFTQYEERNIEFLTPRDIDSLQQILRMQIDSMGQIYVGNQNEAENVMYGAPNAFSQSHTSLFNVSGPINSCARIDQNNPLRTILYAYTTPYGNPGLGVQDGFRMKANLNYRNSFIDALVFEKTEAAQADPDGYIAFTNTGNDSLEEVSFYIDGKGRTYVGHTIDSTINNRLTIESDTLIDASRSGLRFVNLTSTDPTVPNPGIGVLALDSMGNVIYSNAATSFALCEDTINGKLQDDSKIAMNNHNFYFTDSDEQLQNRVIIGYDCTDFTPNPSKLQVRQKYPNPTNIKSTAGAFFNEDQGLNDLLTYTGILAQSSASQDPDFNITNIGGDFRALNARQNYGVWASVYPNSNSTRNYAGYFSAIGISPTASYNYGVFAIASHSQGRNIAVSGIGFRGTTSQYESIGGMFQANNGTYANYGVFAQANGPVGSVVLAGYFLGDVEYTGTLNGVSDQQFKTDVEEEHNVLENLSKLKPVHFKYKTADFPQFNFNGGLNHGFIAQDVEQVFPEFVQPGLHPGEVDSLGNEITAPVTYKAVNYIGIISVAVQGINEVNQKVEKQTLSDQSLKTNVSDLTNSLDKVLAMRGIGYEWDQNNSAGLDLDSLAHIGFIAQEINAIDPRLTYTDANNLMHVEYDKIVPVLAESIEELNGKIESKDSIIDAQQAKIDSLENSVANLSAEFSQLKACLLTMFPNMCEVNQGMIQQNSIQEQNLLKSALEVTLTNRNTIVLSQNVPNPFAESTVIEYNIPSTVKHAQIQFYDMQGKIIQTVDLTERGKGSINVFANDLSSGIYTYTLVADGKVEASKKMVKK